MQANVRWIGLRRDSRLRTKYETDILEDSNGAGPAFWITYRLFSEERRSSTGVFLYGHWRINTDTTRVVAQINTKTIRSLFKPRFILGD